MRGRVLTAHDEAGDCKMGECLYSRLAAAAAVVLTVCAATVTAYCQGMYMSAC
jgi:hypothetical protein